jgi:hypothetical protein
MTLRSSFRISAAFAADNASIYTGTCS